MSGAVILALVTLIVAVTKYFKNKSAKKTEAEPIETYATLPADINL